MDWRTCGSGALRARRCSRRDGLVAVVEREEAVPGRARAAVRTAEGRDAPVAVARERDEAPARRESSAAASGRSGRPDDRDPADDPVGQETALILGKKYDLSARSTNGASVSVPHAAHEVAARSRSRTSCTVVVAPGREPAADSVQTAVERRAGATVSGNHSPTSVEVGDPPAFRPMRRPRLAAGEGAVKGWSAAWRLDPDRRTPYA